MNWLLTKSTIIVTLVYCVSMFINPESYKYTFFIILFMLHLTRPVKLNIIGGLIMTVIILWIIKIGIIIF